MGEKPRDKIIAVIKRHIENDYNARCGGTAFEDDAETIYAYVDIGELDLGEIADDIIISLLSHD